MIPLVLASASPRRRALLEALGITLRVQPSVAEERTAGDPMHVATRNAEMKRDDIVSRLKDPSVVIAADTVVVIAGQILGKPVDLDDARHMLTALSGKVHEVITGVAVTNTETGKRTSGTETTRVKFRPLDTDTIDMFIQTVHPLDRAGAYTVDGPGTLLVEAYQGCYTNVLGLPIPCVDTLLQECGDALLTRMDPDSATFM